MTGKRAILAPLAVVAATVAIVAASGGGSDPYVVRLEMANAGGLRDGSPVAIAGVNVGQVKLGFGNDDQVHADLEIEPSHGPVGRNATAAISAVNLLGQKRVDLDPGDRGHHPAPSGTVIRGSRVRVSTDLDQVLDVLTPDTRARLAILLNEAGSALAGRRTDFAELLRAAPKSVADADTLLTQLVTDNRTLGRVVIGSDRLITEVARRRTALSRLVDVAAQSATTVAGRHRQLRSTLAKAPTTLLTLQRFLGELRTTAAPLGLAARNITATASPLSDTLAQIRPFTSAARPALATATEVAPTLTRLGVGATPVVRRAVPAGRSLATFSKQLVPVSHLLDRSADNIVAILDNWSKAIQFRDGASHVFRGQPSFTPETLRSLITRLLDAPTSKPRSGKRKASKPQQRPLASPQPQEKPAVPQVRLPLPDRLQAPGAQLKSLLKRVPLTPLVGAGNAQSTGRARSEHGGIQPLLDYLLGP